MQSEMAAFFVCGIIYLLTQAFYAKKGESYTQKQTIYKEEIIFF